MSGRDTFATTVTNRWQKAIQKKCSGRTIFPT